MALRVLGDCEREERHFVLRVASFAWHHPKDCLVFASPYPPGDARRLHWQDVRSRRSRRNVHRRKGAQHTQRQTSERHRYGWQNLPFSDSWSAAPRALLAFVAKL